MADYLLDYWYLAAWSHEVGAQPLRRTLFDTGVALYRTGAGQMRAVEDRCPHRFARLSGGRVVGEALECPYHGLRFGPDGKCVHNPFSQVIPPKARVRAFPVVEDDGFIWFWPGEPDLALETPVPDYRFLKQKSTFELLRLYNKLAADFLLGIDNLMELSHAGFLHRNSIGQGTDVLIDLFRRGTYKGWEEDGAVISHWSFSERAHEWAQSRWQAPSSVVVSKGFDHNIPPQPGLMYGLHVFTPETPKSCHYFAIEAFDCAVHTDPGYAERMAEYIGKTVFHDEDCVLLEGIQQHVDEHSADAAPLLLAIDAGAVMARRQYQRLLEAQARARS